MSITDELREWAYSTFANTIFSNFEKKVDEIADRIDEQHEEAIKELSADFEGQLYCESFVNWAVIDKFTAGQRDIEKRVVAIERKLNHRGEFRAVEDVLLEACKAYHGLMTESMSDVAHDMPAPSEVIAEYAAKLRELGVDA